MHDLKAKIFYFMRKRYYNGMVSICKDTMDKSTIENTAFHFYYAVALALNSRIQESTRELNILKSEASTRLASLVVVHLQEHTRKRNLSGSAEIVERETTAIAGDLYHAAFACFAFEIYDKALYYIEKSLSLESDDPEALSLKGWILIFKCGNIDCTEISDVFRKAIKSNGKNLDAAIGLSEALMIQNKHNEAASVVNRCVVQNTSDILPLVQKLMVVFGMREWEQTSDVVSRIQDLQSNELEAMKVTILGLMCRDGKYEEASLELKKYILELEHQEPRNALLLLENAELFSRVCSRHISVLSETYKMSEKAAQLSPKSSQFVTEMGYQALLQNDVDEAHKCFKAATKIDETSVAALIGLAQCEFEKHGRTDNLKQQVEFLLELEDGKSSPMLLLMKTKLLDNHHQRLKNLQKSYKEHLHLVGNHPYGATYLRLLNPDFLLEISRECLKLTRSPMDVFNNKVSSRIDETTDAVMDILRTITTACPGLQEASFLLAKVLYLKGDIMEATNILQHIIDIDGSYSNAHLLLAHIQIGNKMYERAVQSLETCLSCNFKVRENPLYHFLSGLIEKSLDNAVESVKYFKTALSLLDLNSKDFDLKCDFTLADKASVYVELIKCYMSLNQIHEGTKLLNDAAIEFKDTSEEAKISILHSEYLLKNKESQVAIELLSRITSNDRYYLAARTKLADVFLKYRKDKRAYLKCYLEMIESNPGPDSFLLLADAYLRISAPEKALECYEKALKMNPKDPFLTSKMGKALVTTHYYKKAILYYKDTIKLTNDPELKLQLADLYIRLKNNDEAKNLLTAELETEKGRQVNDITALKYKSKVLGLLASISEQVGDLKGAVVNLKTLAENQLRIRKLYSISQNATMSEDIEKLVSTYMKLAELSSTLRNNENAVMYYKEGLSVSPNNQKVLAALAKLYMQMNYMDLCQQVCSTLLSLDPQNEDGTVLMADIAFRKVDFEMATYHFTQLLSKLPTNWHALVRFIEILRRTGKLSEVYPYIQNVEKLSSKDPGFSYCLALYQWYSGNLNSALRNFNIARQHSDFSRQAIYNMIEICLNPDDELLGDHFIDIDDIEYRDSRSIALKTAERLLKELKQKLENTGEDDFKHKLLKNFLLMATKEKPNTEQALENFISLASDELHKDQVGPILGMGMAYTILKQSQRAKNQLKRVIKFIWSFEDAEYLERCWLLLADYYVQAAKFEMATELLRKILQHNKACSKAHEYNGYIFEKEQKYKEAAQCYDQAWKFSGKNNPSVGFKLAYMLMKSKKYAHAIEVSQQVLKHHPDYPRIKKDILDKCMNNLRT